MIMANSTINDTIITIITMIQNCKKSLIRLCRENTIENCLFGFLNHLFEEVSVCLSVCLSVYVSNKRQNDYTDLTQMLYGTTHDPREGLWMLKITKNFVQKFLIFVKFWKCAKKYFQISKIFCSCLILYKRCMLTDAKSLVYQHSIYLLLDLFN